MHEYAIAQALWKAVAEVQTARQLGPIRRVAIELGEFSGIESLLLQLAFEELSVAASGRPAELVVQSISLEAQCQACQCRFPVFDFQFQCPTCASGQVRIVRGEELQLMSVTADIEESVS